MGKSPRTAEKTSWSVAPKVSVPFGQRHLYPCGKGTCTFSPKVPVPLRQRYLYLSSKGSCTLETKVPVPLARISVAPSRKIQGLFPKIQGLFHFVQGLFPAVHRVTTTQDNSIRLSHVVMVVSKKSPRHQLVRGSREV